MRPFKTVDEKFADIGFIKIKDNLYGMMYERKLEDSDFTQVLHLARTATGSYVVLSYDKYLFDYKYVGNTCIGLTPYEMKLCLKKIKTRKWKG